METFEGRWFAYPPLRNALIAGLLAGLAFALGHLGWIPPAGEIALYMIAIPLGGFHWSREGLEKLIERREIGIELLMLAATIGTAALGLWDEAAALVFLYGTAEGLEELVYARTRASIRKLLDLTPKEVRVLRNGQEQIIPAADLRIGDVFLVQPGESIATDGLILEGHSTVNEAPVTGESVPAEKKAGMPVFAGTINLEGVLQVQATATFENNTLARIIHLVEEAQERKGRTQSLVERFERVYSPTVLLSAALMVLFPALLGAPLRDWAIRAVTLVVAAAPCALAMSTPVAIAAGIGRAGLRGVLIKGGVHLENLGRIRVVAFDKTGTLTRGEPTVTDILALQGDEHEVLRLASSVERYSEHPLARAIVRKAEEMGIRSEEVRDFSIIAGYGATARAGDRRIYVGKPGLFRKMGLEMDPNALPRGFQEDGKTLVLVGTGTGLKGIIAIRDMIRPEAREAIRELHRMGVKAAMLTGDREATARAIAVEVGIDEVKADLKPEDKVKAIRELERRIGPVAMVGDGINDAPALAQATVGIAMGAAGTDAAIEAADVALMADDLRQVAFAIRLGRKARRIITQNIAFSILVLAGLIPLAIAGQISVTVAVLAHEISELLAVANGLRAARV
ncbi:putative cadmium-transporting ATPase [Candidatus Thermoflexus japonica]|uniref:Putative cadmium-transporting ATPase n=1 Tax=Candidatus Thermoflexus japonica TaxID=2035417 RepID=A0A2H5Y629_9CHLR|nr:putative cadmium-transporting ATPase [Candidatus Thermoflexus japonica]